MTAGCRQVNMVALFRRRVLWQVQMGRPEILDGSWQVQMGRQEAFDGLWQPVTRVL